MPRSVPGAFWKALLCTERRAAGKRVQHFGCISDCFSTSTDLTGEHLSPSATARPPGPLPRYAPSLKCFTTSHAQEPRCLHEVSRELERLDSILKVPKRQIMSGEAGAFNVGLQRRPGSRGARPPGRRQRAPSPQPPGSLVASPAPAGPQDANSLAAWHTGAPAGPASSASPDPPASPGWEPGPPHPRA